MTVVVALEGVLRDSTLKVIPETRDMFLSLVQHQRVVVALDDADVDKAEIWLRMNALTGHAEVIPRVAITARGIDERVAQIETLQGRAQEITLVYDASPERVAAVLQMGVPACLFCHPKYSRPEFRPDYTHIVRPWNDLVAEITLQRYSETVNADA